GVSALVLLLVALARAEAADAALEKELEASITRAIEDELREAQVPGAAVAILRDGDQVYLRAFGVRSLEEATPVTPDTLFRLGSTTKMMTALVALDAAAQGRLGLETPVRTYVKDLHPALGKLTPKLLLTHSAGLREASPSVQSRDDSGLGEMVRGWKGDYLFAPPGDVFSYSGPSYWLAGLTLERVYGKPYAEVMRERLFQPLEMARSTLRPLEALTWDCSQGHEEAGGALKVVRPMAENTAMYPAGSAFSSARELVKFTGVMLNGGMADTRRVFSEQTVRQFFTSIVPLPGEAEARYGFGLVSYPVGGTPVFEHGGVRRGYGSHIRFLPERRGAIILLTNKNGVTLRKSLGHISQAVFGLPDEPERKAEAAPLTASEAERYTGTYVHADLVRFTVSWDGQQLVLKTDSAQPLERMRQDTFRTKEGQELAFVFKPGQTRARYLHMDMLTAIRPSK
ncbi:serine hydrolase domain-containing protein, partial [Hyalangium sp.]|uniref:serine hydrolase domain-containing protein n=1 Tax=Hyalangium sp. TaxID=2028555 RepID=UPI002D721F58